MPPSPGGFPHPPHGETRWTAAGRTNMKLRCFLIPSIGFYPAIAMGASPFNSLLRSTWVSGRPRIPTWVPATTDIPTWVPATTGCPWRPGQGALAQSPCLCGVHVSKQKHKVARSTDSYGLCEPIFSIYSHFPWERVYRKFPFNGRIHLFVIITPISRRNRNG